MHFITSLFHIILEALFPRGADERRMLRYSPQEALHTLPPAPNSPLEHSSAVFAYKDERVRQMIWNIKYHRSPAAVAIGGYALHDKLNHLSDEFKLSSPILILPMPITTRRRRERGYNQTELIVAELARLDTSQKFRIITDLLVRTHHVARQTMKGREERIESAKGIFGLNEEVCTRLKAECAAGNKYQFSMTNFQGMFNWPIFIIDDVITTGSTMKEAMETMKHHGFNKVYGLSIAH